MKTLDAYDIVIMSWWMALALLISGLGIATAAQAKAKEPVELQAVYTREQCPPCRRVMDNLFRRRVTLQVYQVQERAGYGTATPLCKYSDGTQDNGQRLFGGATVPGVVKVYNIGDR